MSCGRCIYWDRYLLYFSHGREKKKKKKKKKKSDIDGVIPCSVISQGFGLRA